MRGFGGQIFFILTLTVMMCFGYPAVTQQLAAPPPPPANASDYQVRLLSAQRTAREHGWTVYDGDDPDKLSVQERMNASMASVGGKGKAAIIKGSKEYSAGRGCGEGVWYIPTRDGHCPNINDGAAFGEEDFKAQTTPQAIKKWKDRLCHDEYAPRSLKRNNGCRSER
jgi:hypothetical protein